jgi:hypothetical protein
MGLDSLFHTLKIGWDISFGWPRTGYCECIVLACYAELCGNKSVPLASRGM